MKTRSLRTCLTVFLLVLLSFMSASGSDFDEGNDTGADPQLDSLTVDIPGQAEVVRVNPDNPGIPVVANDYAVGTPAGSFSVSESGAALYSVAIDCPDGKGLTPQIGISYSSGNAGYGLAGYGFTISGLSSITRGGKTPFNDGGVAAGVGYGADDNLFLDGKKLILQTGTAFTSDAVYCLEGDPYTKIIVHDCSADNILTAWFEVQAPDGMKYEYGRNSDSRLTFTPFNDSKKVASWHLNRIEDVYGNYATYSYTAYNLYLYPKTIIYGENAVKSRGVSHRIEFNYENTCWNNGIFNIGSVKGEISRRLSDITTYTGTSVYRKYYLSYDTSSDGTAKKFDRLTSIREENGEGESLTPIRFEWSPLPAVSLTQSSFEIPANDANTFVKADNRFFFAADLNGDGVSDIIRVSPVEVWNGPNYTTSTNVYISRSSVSSNGCVTYEKPVIFLLPSQLDDSNIKLSLGGASLLDYDGDGLNDLIIPYHATTLGVHSCIIYMIYGKKVAKGQGGNVPGIEFGMIAADKMPLLVAFDADKDGKDDIFYLEPKQKDNSYAAALIRNTDASVADPTIFNIVLPSEPKKIFSGDYNNDGLTDIIIFHEGGYKVYFNNGVSGDTPIFTETNTRVNTSFCDKLRMSQGDIDGDGLIDFVYYEADRTWINVARNNGDGTFAIALSDDIGVKDSSAKDDDDKFSLSVYDIDGDGRSDVHICKGEKNNMHFIRLCSDGTTLKLKDRVIRARTEDAKESYVFTGDFDGDGNLELANYGGNLLTTSGTFVDNRINVYTNSARKASTGRITAFIDGMDNRTDVTYGYLSTPAVYSKTVSQGNTYPFNTYTLPITVVKSVTSTNGAAGTQTADYGYKDLRIHIAGGGVTGFDEISTTDRATGRKSTRRITKWDEEHLVPLETVTTDSVGEYKSSVVTTYTVAPVGNTYFAYESGNVITDMDGHTAVTTNTYDTEKGVPLEQKVSNDGDNMYKKSVYSSYQLKGGRWLPANLHMEQKHSDDATAFTTWTHYIYDEKGNVLSSVERYRTSMSLSTRRTYDEYGNCLTLVKVGSNVKEVTVHNEYDSTGRFVVRTYTKPASAVSTFTYDMWGNVLTASDETQPGNILTTTYTYDGWGRRIKSEAPDGTVMTSETGWGNADNRKYYTLTRTSHKPWVLIWYDKAGHEMEQTTFGPKNVKISKTTGYNDRGLVSYVSSLDGKVRNTERLTYDILDRVITSKTGSGKETSYSYGDRSVTTTTDGRVSTVYSDAWGNPVKTVDPLGKCVEYEYGSIGKPVTVTTESTTVSMTYDKAGHQTSVEDSDAGKHRYEYAADGTVLKHTDPKGVVTLYTYDNLGRLAKTQIGDNSIVNTYGTTGVEKLKLTGQTMGDNSVEYTHDKYGRIVSARKNISGQGAFAFTYTYDSQNRLQSATYPGSLSVSHEYDDYGFCIATIAAGKKIYSLEDYEGGAAGTTVFADSTRIVRDVDAYGYISSISLSCGARELDRMEFTFDHARDNLLKRKRKDQWEYNFDYDELDRLVIVSHDKSLPWVRPTFPQKKPTYEVIGMAQDTVMVMTYSPDGNILSKTGVGAYTYDANIRPHAVVGVENSGRVIPTSTLSTVFNKLDRIQTIEDLAAGLSMEFDYGPDIQRWTSTLKSNGRDSIITVYAGNYEKITENGKTREFYYLDGGAIVVKENGVFKPYISFSDYQGSILSVFDPKGNNVFKAEYDAWGMQTVSTNTIGLRRGYTGHEMLPEFGIINMNGRLYDPVLGRFFSPDPYVQFAGSPQSYNRYSYCLNNPLKYTDPSGQSIAGFVAFGLFNLATSMMRASFNHENIWKAGAMSLLSSAVSYGIGELFKTTGSIGRELLRAGTHGAASGVLNILGGGDFVSGFVSGAVASGIGHIMAAKSYDLFSRITASSFTAGMAAWMVGGDFVKGALQGLSIAIFNEALHDQIYDEIYEQEGEYRYNFGVSVMCSKIRPELDPRVFYAMYTTNSVIDAVAGAVSTHAGNSTFGSNGKFYFHADGTRGFYGNKYVTTRMLAPIGSYFHGYTKAGGWVGGILNGGKILEAVMKDVNLYQKTGEANFGNTAEAATEITVSWAGAKVGAKVGAKIGFIVGSAFGVSTIPLMIVGGAVGGFLGGYYGPKVFNGIISWINN